MMHSEKNFWKTLSRPVMLLAPMEDVTDTAFRELVMRISNPEHLDVLFTEFTSTDGFCHEVGRENVIKRFKISDSERHWLDKTNTKIVAQIWGTDPEKFYRSAKHITGEMDFDGIDINMGCPVKKIVKNGGCSALINTPELAKEIILATKEGTNLPVSVKTRTGNSKNTTPRRGLAICSKPNPLPLPCTAAPKKPCRKFPPIGRKWVKPLPSETRKILKP
ncbi:MAG: tRNA-dihydrouridine synthase family protein [Bacteroidales bacterium]|nr:tRNA-dihydrouridine synthase family protein [Bacteroidales bacterium]